MSKKVQVRRVIALAIPMIVFMLLALGMIMGMQNVAARPEPKPVAPPFEGTFTSISMRAPSEDSNCDVNDVSIDVGEGYTATFEAGLGTGWVACDNDGLTNGEYFWGTETATNGPTITGTRSVWSFSRGEDGGGLDPISDTYPSTADTWLIFGPFDLTNVTSASLQFDFWFDGGEGDSFGVFSSNNGSSFEGLLSEFSTSDWRTRSFTLNSELGQSDVYIAFYLNRGSGDSTKKGAFVDNVILDIEPLDEYYLPLIRWDVTPTPAIPTPAPFAYRADFDINIEDWRDVRHDLGVSTQNQLDWKAEQGGIVSLGIFKEEQYFIASPMVEGPEETYTITSRIEFVDIPADDEQYAILFSGSADDPNNCINDLIDNCFDTFYALRVIYNHNNDDPELTIKFAEVDRYNSDNTPVWEDNSDLIELANDKYDPFGYNEWVIVVEAGKATAYINGDEVATAEDDDYAGQRYFGILVEDKVGRSVSAVNIDYFYIDNN